MINWIMRRLLRSEWFMPRLIFTLKNDSYFQFVIKDMRYMDDLKMQVHLLERIKKLEEVTSLIKSSLLSQPNFIGDSLNE